MSAVALLIGLAFAADGWVGRPAARAFGALAITGAKIVVRPGEVIEGGTIVIRDGRIAAVGAGVEVPVDAERLDATGLTAYPGFIDAASSFGLPRGDERQRRSGSGRDVDVDLTREALAATRKVDRKGIFPEYSAARDLRADEETSRRWRRAGFTAAHVSPGDALLAGTSAVVLLADAGHATTPEAVVRADVAMMAGWEAPGDGYPRSLMGAIAHLRQTLLDAEHYRTVKGLYEDTDGATARPTYDVALEALRPVLDGGMPVVFPASTRDEIHRALAFAAEFSLRPVIQGGREASRARDRLVRDRVPVILHVDFPVQPRQNAIYEERVRELARVRGVTLSARALREARRADRANRIPEPRRAFEDRLRLWNEQVATAATLAAAGVRFALTTSGQRDGEEFLMNLRRAIDAGVPVDTAVSALTAVPAELLGVTRELGSLEVGKLGNVTLMEGDLGKRDSRVRWVVIAGVKYEPRVDDEEATDTEGDIGEPGEASAPAGRAAAGADRPVETDADRVPPTRTGGNLLIRNATVLTITQGTRPATDILVRDGVIAEIGANLDAPAGVTVIDGSGAWVMPGIIDDHSHMAAAGGINEGTLSITAQVRIEDVLRGDDLTIYRAAAGGVTTANVLHGSANTIGGQRAIIQMKYDRPVDELLFPDQRRGIKFALGENVTRNRSRFPNTRMGVEAVIRRAFREAQVYEREWRGYRERMRQADRPLTPPRRDVRLETLAGILSGEILVHSHGYNADELFMLLGVLEEFGVRELTLEHALEAYKIAPEIARFGNRGAFVSTFADMWAYKMEAYDAIPYNVALITEAGGRAIINSDSGERVRRLYADAAKMVRFGGLTYDQALETITLNPAMALHIDDRVGSIEVGKRADLALFNGHPLNTYARPFLTLVAGEVVFERPGPRGGPYPLPEKRETAPAAAATSESAPAARAGVGPRPNEELPRGAAARGGGAPRAVMNEPAPRNPDARYAIVNAAIYPVSRPMIPRGTIVFERGRIVAVGPDAAVPPGTTIVDAAGLHVYPGMIDGGSTLGLDEIGDIAVTQDSSESGVIQPDLRAAVAVKPDSEIPPVARFTGLTSAVTAPSGGLVPGQAALIQLAGWTPADMAYVDPLALQINIPDGAGSLDVQALVGPRTSEEREPSAEARLDRLRELFRDARAYADLRERTRAAGAPSDAYEPDLEALIPYIRKERPVMFSASEAADILLAIDLAKELDVDAILRGCEDGWKVAREIAASGFPVVLSPVTRMPTDRYDPYDSAYASAAVLHAAGVTIGFQSNSDAGARLLPFQAGLAVAFGLPQEAALRAVTLGVAEIFDVDDRVGSLDPGKRADLIVVDGDPLQPVSSVRYMFIGGEPIDIDENRHTRLYEKYRQRLTEGRDQERR